MDARRSRTAIAAVLMLVAFVVVAAAIPGFAAADGGGWLGEYYANPFLMGPPALIRTDARIDFDWGGGQPVPQVPADHFSVRWTRTLNLDSGRYRFTTETDDGVRLFLDGALIIEEWHDQTRTAYTAELDVVGGAHSLRMEYYQANGGSSARLTWQRIDSPPQPPPAGPWRGEYFPNRYLSGTPAMVRDDGAIDFNWSSASPAPHIPQDNFSVRWTRTLPIDSGRYRFTTTTDDGVRLYLDGKLIIDQWHDQPATTLNAERDLGSGQHSLRMEYYQASGDSVARLSWKRISSPPSPGPWRGEYFTNPSLSGSPRLVRDDASINFNWGFGSPAPEIPPDNFSVRWTRTVNFGGGRYKFKTTTDDGVRLYVDGELIIDRWYEMDATAFTAEKDLSPGNHTIRMKYFEHLGLAVAKLSWEKVKDDTPVPVGNIVTCARPGSNSWIKVYRLDGGAWVDTNPGGYGPIGSSGRLKLDGFSVDTARYASTGHPYRVEVWSNGRRVYSVGNTAGGEAPFNVRAWADNYTPWGCP